jgi:hypothetical protein
MGAMNNTRFVKIHPNLGCMLSATEVAFLVLLLDQEYYKNVGCDSAWSRAYFQKHTGVSNATFVKCAERMKAIGLVSSHHEKAGEKKKYSLNIDAYNRMLELLDSTNNREALTSFCTSFFSGSNSIMSISKEQIETLKTTRKRKTMFKNDMVNTGDVTMSENAMVFGNPVKNDMVRVETIAENDRGMSKSDMVLGEKAETIVKNDMVREIYSKTLSIFDMVSKINEKLDENSTPTLSENDMVTLKNALTHIKNDTLLLNNVRTMSESDMVLEPNVNKCANLVKNDMVVSGNHVKNDIPLSKSDSSIEYIYNNIIISLKEYFKEEFKELNKEIKEDIKKLNKKGYEVSFFTKDKDRGVGEGETKNLQFEVQAQTPSFEEKDSSSSFTPSFKKTEEKDSDAPSIPSFKKEEEETVQSEVPQTPSPNQKFIDMLIRDMMEEYPEGDTPKWMELKKTFSELKEDYFSHDEELSRLEIEDLFPYFESRGCRVGIHYSEWKEKTEEEIREEFMSLPVSENYDESLISLSDDEKIEMIKEDFRESFPVDEKVTLDEMRQFVVEYMRDLELLRIGRVQYDNPQLLSFMFPELQMDKETKLWFRSQNKARGETICSDGGKMIEIQLKFREEAENARKQENPFYKKLERYRFPRISIGENRDCQAIEIIPKLLSDMGYKNGDMEDWDTISQLLDVIIDRYKLYGSGFEPFRGIWVYLDKYDHKQKGKVQVRNLPEK